MMKLESLTREILLDLYIKDKKSLQDIAELYSVSRVAVYKKLNKFGINQRSKSEARLEAQKQHKLPQEFFQINESFFDSWSAEMAYILGLLITDGCISKTGVVSLCINDLELLEKVKNVLGAEHNIMPSKHQPNLFHFAFARKHMVERLLVLGVTPQKSLTVKFPAVPDEYSSNFIRGVFDGDGSVFFDKRRKKSPLRAKFVSSSEHFIQGLSKALEILGMPSRNIYKQKTKNGWSFMFIYEHADSAILFRILYQNAPDKLFLERKYNKFLQGLREAKNG